MATVPDPVAEVAALRLAAWRQAAAGDAHAAVATYARALALVPNDPTLLTAAADAQRFTGDLDAAIALFDRALALDRSEVAAWYGRALAHDAVGATAAARDDFARVTVLAPKSAPGFAGLAAAAARLGDVDTARAAARTALKLSPNDATTMITLARCDLTRGRPAMAVERLDRLLARRGATGDDAVVALGLLGDALDRLGRVDAAFAAYASAKTRLAARLGHDGAPVARHQAEAVAAAVAALPANALTAPVPPVAGEAATHVFLLGYPRSGTTLVEQVLAGAVGVTSLEEAPTLAAAAPYLADLPALAALDDAGVAALRADYWARVAAAGAAPPPGGAFVDMDPFKSLALPLIARLFPAATIVHVRRDPRDVVWSCFRRSFVAGPVAAEFTALPRAARHYAATMRLIDTCRTALPLDLHDLRYEDLVADFDDATQRLCAATGIAWSPAMRDFPATARARRVKTASAAQVRRPLFDGSGQWRRYAAYLGEAEAILAPWL
jgi:tetratricopeptide (TPR) repeat protein